MGTEDNEKKSVAVMFGGKPVEIRLEIVHAELEHNYTAPFGLGAENNFLILAEGKLEIKAKYPKRLRCKNRKRFIKLLMASGANRNTAQKTANYVVWTNQKGIPMRFEMSYQRYYTELWYCGAIRL